MNLITAPAARRMVAAAGGDSMVKRLDKAGETVVGWTFRNAAGTYDGITADGRHVFRNHIKPGTVVTKLRAAATPAPAVEAPATPVIETPAPVAAPVRRTGPVEIDMYGKPRDLGAIDRVDTMVARARRARTGR